MTTTKYRLYFLAMLCFLGFSGIAAAQSFPLVCRGGGGTLGYNSDNGGSALIYFQKSPAPAGSGLTPGRCSWIDRRIGENEPTCAKQTVTQAAAWLFPGGLNNSYMTSSQAPWLRSLLSSSQFQTFQVYNPGNGGCFVVTRLGP